MRSKISSPTVINCQRAIPVAVAPLANFFERARRELSFPQDSVTVRLIGDPAMARLNLSFRGKRGPTDVLSFPASSQNRKSSSVRRALSGKNAPHNAPNNDLSQAEAYIGDIAISPQTAARNARAGSRTLQAELRILILHGMIHLAGYDHETDRGEMTRLETRLRRRLNLIATEVHTDNPASVRRRKSTKARLNHAQTRVQR